MKKRNGMDKSRHHFFGAGAGVGGGVLFMDMYLFKNMSYSQEMHSISDKKIKPTLRD